jgi:hypothetical protein
MHLYQIKLHGFKEGRPQISIIELKLERWRYAIV